MGKWHEFFCTLMKDPRATRSDLVNHRRRAVFAFGSSYKKIISVAKPHFGRQPSAYVRVVYINNVCNHLKEMEAFKREV